MRITLFLICSIVSLSAFGQKNCAGNGNPNTLGLLPDIDDCTKYNDLLTNTTYFWTGAMWSPHDLAELYNGHIYLDGTNQKGIVHFDVPQMKEVGLTIDQSDFQSRIFSIDEGNGFESFLEIEPQNIWMQSGGNITIDAQNSGSSIGLEEITGNIGLYNGVTGTGLTVDDDVIITGDTTGIMRYNEPQFFTNPESVVTKRYVDDEIASAASQQFIMLDAVLLNADDPFPTTTTIVDNKGFLYIPDYFDSDYYIERVFFNIADDTQDGTFTVGLVKDGTVSSPLFSFSTNTTNRTFNPNNTPFSNTPPSGIYHLIVSGVNYTVPPTGLSIGILLKKYK